MGEPVMVIGEEELKTRIDGYLIDFVHEVIQLA
jgi:hypothetical protein